MNIKGHWEDVYQSRHSDEVSWYRPHLEVSLELIQKTGIGRDARIIDVGGGASSLVDDLLAEGFTRITVLDIAESALEDAKARLGDRADTITWRVADVTEVDLPDRTYDIWHDRAVFHFLTDAADRQKYAKQAGKAVKPGGYMIMATFGPEGPTQCSGLDVIRYAADDLEKIFGADFTLLESRREDHQTPAGKTQQFIYALFQRKSD